VSTKTLGLLDSLHLTADEVERLTAEGTLVQDYSAAERRRMAKSGAALSDGSFPIANCTDVENAASRSGSGKASKSTVNAHIRKRARALNCAVPNLSEDEGNGMLTSLIIMEGEVPAPVIVQEATEANHSTMRVKTPFFIGDSFARAPGFNKRIFWPKEKLPEIVQEMKARINSKQQPLTVYARHNHAISGDYLPIGGIVDVEIDGRIGYVTEEIEPTSTGRDVQILLRSGKLNAASLRSGPGNFELTEKRVNQEDVYWPEHLVVDGVDWAPDKPAMPTYGVQILHEAPNVEAPKPPEKPQEGGRKLDNVTVDLLRRENATIVAEIEAPFRTQIETLTNERNEARTKVKTLEDRQIAQEKDWELVRIAQGFSDPEKALKYLQQECKDCTTKDQVASKVLPIVMEAQRKKAANTPPEKTQAQLLQEMLFPGSGRGHVAVTQEGAANGNGSATAAAEFSGESAAGLPVPE
jgi:hypothetical protein